MTLAVLPRLALITRDAVLTVLEVSAVYAAPLAVEIGVLFFSTLFSSALFGLDFDLLRRCDFEAELGLLGWGP